jgi:predicted trehalose synthase
MASRTPPSDVLAAWLAAQRWFAAGTRRIARLEVEDTVPMTGGALVLARVALVGGGVDRYLLALAPVGWPGATAAGRAEPGGRGSAGRSGPDVADALDDPAFCHALRDLAARGGRAAGRTGEVVGCPGPAPAPAEGPASGVRRIGGEQSNSSVAFGDVLILKLFRRLAEGVNPEEEVTRFLTTRAFAQAPRLHGHVEYRPGGGAPITVAVLQAQVPSARDGWEWMLAELAALHRAAEGEPGPARLAAAAAPTLRALRRLGEVTGTLHVALASDARDEAFAPEPIGPADVAGWAAAVHTQLRAARAAAGDAGAVPPLPALEPALSGLLGRVRIRHHGDLHLGQTLCRGGGEDFVIIDFEGEPLRPLAERRRKHAAVRDVAGMLRSIGYAAAASLAAAGGAGPDGVRARWAEAWEAAAAQAFVAGYRATTRGAPFAPVEDEAFARAVAVFEVEKAAYEVVYEASHRPDWLPIPRRGLLRAAARLTGATGAAGA